MLTIPFWAVSSPSQFLLLIFRYVVAYHTECPSGTRSEKGDQCSRRGAKRFVGSISFIFYFRYFRFLNIKRVTENYREFSKKSEALRVQVCFFIFPNEKFQIAPFPRIFSSADSSLLLAATRFEASATSISVAGGSLAGLTSSIYNEVSSMKAHV